MKLKLFTFILFIISVVGFAQTTITPKNYYTFNGTNASQDSMNANNINFGSSIYSIQTGGQVGKYLNLGGIAISAGALQATNQMAVELLFKPGYDWHGRYGDRSLLFYRADYAIYVEFNFYSIRFETNYRNSSGTNVSDLFEIVLNGIDRKSYGYYVDGNWHHLVFNVNLVNGTKELWVDGVLPSGFNKTIVTGTFQNTNTAMYLNSNTGYVAYRGNMDEIAYYDKVLPPAFIYKHYLGVQNGTPYSFLNNYSGNLPTAPAISGPIDVNEFAIGHPSPTQSVITQVKNYPAPRFKSNHTLMRNVNWMNALYLGRWNQPGVTQQQAWSDGDTIQVELARTFNYYFNVELGSNGGGHSAANANPDLPISMITHRYWVNSLLAGHGTLPNDHYLQNSSGQFLDVNGNVTTNKIWRPTSPPSSYTPDGNTMRSWVLNMFNTLNRNISLVNENGEIFPIITQNAMQLDPQVTAAKNASGLGWSDFLARKMMENETQAYRDVFMNSHPKISGAIFTEYDIDGYRPSYTFEYIERRKVNDQINGQYYSTPSFYPRWPQNWRFWSGAWHGWQWIVESRGNEIALGDKLYSPFIAAGWDAVEENNMRPAQWLGLLKVLGITGAEFYYTGFFSLTAPWPDAKNWAWQSVIPAYAQAITSRYEDILRNGNLMAGDVPNNFINNTAPGFSFMAGDMRKLVVIRKHDTVDKYAITGTLQPRSNMIGDAENEGVAQITLAGSTLKFKVRRQGSTYIYDKSNPSAPIFYQLDGWHEKTHPSKWTADFNFEAELFDNTNPSAIIKTIVPAGTPSGDYTNFTSFVSWNSISAIEYKFKNRSNNTLYLWVRAKSKDGNSTGVSIKLDNGSTKTIDCITDTNWVWYRYENPTNTIISYSNVAIGEHTLNITPTNDKLYLDQIILTTNSNLGLNNNGPNCSGTPVATITANGPTTFCQGNNVVLSASSGISYLWSNGATTQNITVSTSGNYSCVVTTAIGSATSNTINVIVNSLPVATITANGPTTFCQGNNVVLSASSGTSYLWSNGATTQSITVNNSGTFTVTVTGSNGCTAQSSPKNVIVNPLPIATITASGSTTICSGQLITLTASSGSSYAWSNGATTQSISVGTAGNYSVTITNSSGCSAQSPTTTIVVNSLPTATITANGPTNICAGQNVTLTASTGSSYLWSTGATTQSIVVGTAGNYFVTVTNSNGCSTQSSPINVVVNLLPNVSITPSGPTTFCQGGSVTLTANGGNQFLWSTGAITQSIVVSTNGTYNVTVTNSNGCSAQSSSVSIVVNSLPTPTITANGPTTFCQGSNVVLSASSGTSYLWSNGATTQNITASTSGNYYVTITNSNGCSAQSAITIVTVNSLPTATITPSGTVTICSGQTTTLTANSANSYLWSNGATTQSIVVGTSGSYSVTTTNSSGCSSQSSVTTVVVNNCTTCNVPSGLTNVNIQSTTATLSWNTVPNATSYSIKLTNVTLQTITYIPATSNTITIFVNPGTKYKWNVRSKCPNNQKSNFSAPLRFITPISRTIVEENMENLNAMEEEELFVYPNPTINELNVIFESNSISKAVLKITDNIGKLFYFQEIELKIGINEFKINTTNFPPNIYLIFLIKEKNYYVRKFVKIS